MDGRRPPSRGRGPLPAAPTPSPRQAVRPFLLALKRAQPRSCTAWEQAGLTFLSGKPKPTTFLFLILHQVWLTVKTVSYILLT